MQSLPRRSVLSAALALGAGAVAVACGSGSSTPAPSGSSGGGGAFPVTVRHKVGETTVPAAPARVASVGYYDQDTLLALGVVPVATREFTGNQPFATWPWARRRLGTAQPVVFPLQEVGLEALVAVQPDLIVGVSGGLTQAQYDAYSKIAPTVPAPAGFVDYGVPLADTTRLLGSAVGKPAEAEKLLTDLQARIARTRARYPQLAGRTVAGVRPSTDATGGFFVYGAQDLRSRFFADLGMRGVPMFDQTAGDRFYGEYSGEQLSLLDQADVVVLYVQSDQERTVFQSRPGYSTLRVVRESRVLTLPPEQAAALSFNSVLSIPVVLDAVPPAVIGALR